MQSYSLTVEYDGPLDQTKEAAIIAAMGEPEDTDCRQTQTMHFYPENVESARTRLQDIPGLRFEIFTTVITSEKFASTDDGVPF